MSGPRVLVAGPDRLDDYLRPYCEALALAGAEPVRGWPPAEARVDLARAADWLAGFAGLLLPGGADVDPARYGEPQHEAAQPPDAELDAGQLALTRAALESGHPTLGICRGIQVLGVAAGGSLFQDLPSQGFVQLNHRQREPRDLLAHEVQVDPSSRLAAAVGATRFPVNSRHHQAVRDGAREGRVGPLRVVARAPDGVVEGLEHPGHPWLVAVQWHPENLVASRAEARSLFRSFVAACEHADHSGRKT